jgi:hypothetical protein
MMLLASITLTLIASPLLNMTSMLRTYVGSRKVNNPLTLYAAKLSEVPSLFKLYHSVV